MGTYALTGGATGIGAAIKKRMIKNGHDVIMIDLKDADIEADLSTEAGRSAAINGIRAAASEGLDGLITCAGLASHIPDHALVTSVNFYGSTTIVDGVKDLIAKNKGSIILVSSNSAPMCKSPEYIDALLNGNESDAREIAEGIDGHDVYSGSKQAITRWMRSRIQEFASMGLTINAIAPGYTETPMTKAVAEDPQYGPAIKEFVNSIPVQRAGQPDDIADLTEFLLSDKARFICGSMLYIDGGHDALMRPDNI